MKSTRSLMLWASAGLVVSGAAQAMSHSTDPTAWRFVPGDTFNGASMNGVARILFDSDGELTNGSYVCSGTLLAGGTHVVTAGHCADNFNVMQIDFGVANDVALATRGAAAAYVNPYWTGELAQGVDIAVIRLDSAVTGIQGFNLGRSSAVGSEVLMMGYGTTTKGAPARRRTGTTGAGATTARTHST